jgi:hypothetical protein
LKEVCHGLISKFWFKKLVNILFIFTHKFIKKEPGKIMMDKSKITLNKDGKFWNIPEIVYMGKTGDYELFKKMIPSMSQYELSEFYNKSKLKGEPYPANSLLLMKIISRAYSLRNQNIEDVEELRRFLKVGCREFPNTLSRVIYIPEGNDEVIHNCGTFDQYSLRGDIVGASDILENMPNRKALELVLGTKDVGKINRVFNWINGTDGDICRLSSREFNSQRILFRRVEKCIKFCAGKDSFSVSCLGDPSYKFPAFRVLKVG